MNKTILIGRLTKAPEVRSNNDKSVARFTVAVDRKYKKDGEPSADFISCVAFNKTADFVGKYFSKGSKIVLEGSIRTGSYEKDGQKVYTTDVIVETVEFAESKATQGEKPSEGGFVSVPDDDELPFQ